MPRHWSFLSKLCSNYTVAQPCERQTATQALLGSWLLAGPVGLGRGVAWCRWTGPTGVGGRGSAQGCAPRGLHRTMPEIEASQSESGEVYAPLVPGPPMLGSNAVAEGQPGRESGLHLFSAYWLVPVEATVDPLHRSHQLPPGTGAPSGWVCHARASSPPRGQSSHQHLVPSPRSPPSPGKRRPDRSADRLPWRTGGLASVAALGLSHSQRHGRAADGRRLAPRVLA